MTAQEIFDYYTSQIRQATLNQEKAQAKAAWDAAYDALPLAAKTDIKAIMQQRAAALLKSQEALDRHLMLAGLPNLDDALAASSITY